MKAAVPKPAVPGKVRVLVSVCGANDGHARRRRVRCFSCAPSERGLERDGRWSP